MQRLPEAAQARLEPLPLLRTKGGTKGRIGGGKQRGDRLPKQKGLRNRLTGLILSLSLIHYSHHWAV
jgi:hypothetical protein